jgi:peptide/nickel transport system permease protein
MWAYLIRRLWQMVPTLIGVVLLVFFLFKYFGADPAVILGGLNATQDQVAAIRTQLGLDQPWWVQLGIYLKQIVTFDWGRSWATNEAVSSLFATRLPATLTVMIPILILDTLLALPIAMWVAYRRGSLSDRTIMVITTVALSISFLVYIIVGQYVFGFQLGWFPVQGWSDSTLTNLLTFVPLPVLLAVLVGVSPQTRLYRTFVLDELGHDYVRTDVQARAAQRTDPDHHQHRVQPAGHLCRLFPDRGVLLDPRARPRGAAGGQPQRLSRHPGDHGVPGDADDADQPGHRRAVQGGRPARGVEVRSARPPRSLARWAGILP